MKALPHQVAKSTELYETLKKYGYAYLNGQPRSGKTYTAILAAELCNDNVKDVLVLTKKAAIEGWSKFITPDLKKRYTITNYEQASKLKPIYQLLIIDESHNIGAFPKPSQRWRAIYKLAVNAVHIHLSGTPVVESPMAIYHQMNLGKWTPFRFRNFYDFHRAWGIPDKTYIAGRLLETYKKSKPELMEEIAKFTVTMSQADAGITAELTDQEHWIDLTKSTKDLYNKILKERLATIEDHLIVCDTTMGLRLALHQIEGGTLKVDDTCVDLGNREKVNYIKEHFGDSEDTGIMSHFIGERQMLEREFKHAKIYSSNAHSEGVDLSHLKHFIIYSSDYSGSRFIQRRERIVNINGSNTTTIHHLLVKNAISHQVYKVVAKKMDFNNDVFIKTSIS